MAQETGTDTFQAFFTNGLLQGDAGEYILDDGGNFIYDGWVSAIGPLIAKEDGVDVFSISGLTAITSSGSFATSEFGSDASSITGAVAVSGLCVAGEFGGDDPYFLGDGAKPELHGHSSLTEMVTDTFQAFFTNGLLQGDAGEYILDDGGNFIYDGWVSAIGPLTAQESGVDTTLWQGSNSQDVVGELFVQEPTSDALSAHGDVLVIGSVSSVEGAVDTLVASGSGISTGAIATAESGSDTCSLPGNVVVSGTMESTDGHDISALSGAIIVSGQFTPVDPGHDTATVVGLVKISGNLGADEPTGNDTVFATGYGYTSGTMSLDESGQDVATVSGDVFVLGHVSATEQPDSVVVSGDVPLTGHLDATDNNHDAAGFTGGPVVTGAVVGQEQSFDLHSSLGSVTWTPIIGEVAPTEQEDTPSCSGIVLVRGGCAAIEKCGDSASIDAAIVVAGTIAALEIGLDAYAATGIIYTPTQRHPSVSFVKNQYIVDFQHEAVTMNFIRDKAHG